MSVPSSAPIFRDVVIVQRRRHVDDPHGGHYEDAGAPITLSGVCVEGRDNGSDVGQIRILVRGDWPGDIHSMIRWNGMTYDAVGAPIVRPHGFHAAHTVVTARRIA